MVSKSLNPWADEIFSLKITFVYNELGKRRQPSDLFVCSGLNTVSFLKSFSPKKAKHCKELKGLCMAKVLEEIFIDMSPFSNLQPIGHCICNQEILLLR